MSYIKTEWKNNVTPLNAENMNKIEEGIEMADIKASQAKSDVFDLENKIDKVVPTTWQALVNLRNAKALMPGRYYRITDYETTTVQVESRSAGHFFDVIVLALSEDKIAEEAFATHSARDTEGYFDEAKLEAWKLWYRLDNDTESFAWADEENGKGVIYRLIDEWNNDLPYDFKNIQFKRYMVTDIDVENGDSYFTNTFVGRYYGLKTLNGDQPYNSKLTIDDGDFAWMYTFSVFFINDTKRAVDVSTKQDYVISDEGFFYKTTNNKIGSWFEPIQNDELEKSEMKRPLLNSVFVYFSEEDEGGTYDEFYGFYNNTIGNDFYYNTIGNNFNNNTIGNYFNNNTIGNYFYNNTIGNYFNYNTIGNNFNNNTIGNNFNNNTIGNNFNYNTIGNYFYYNTIGNGVQYVSVPNYEWNTVFANSNLLSGLSGASSNNLLKLELTGTSLNPAGAENATPRTYTMAKGGKFILRYWDDLTEKVYYKSSPTASSWTESI